MTASSRSQPMSMEDLLIEQGKKRAQEFSEIMQAIEAAHKVYPKRRR